MAPAVKKPVRRGRRTQAKKRPAMTLERRMKKIALSTQETKLKSWTLLNNENTRGSGLGFGTVTLRKGVYVDDVLGSASMNMTQGTSQQQMLGNKIQNCKLNIRGFVHSRPFDATSNTNFYPFEVHLLAYKRKDSPANNPDKILQGVNNTNVSIDGSAASSLLPFNRDGYVIKRHKVFKMKANPIAAVSTIPNVVGVENPTYNAGDYQFFKRFSLNIPIKSTLLFDDAVQSPKNDWCCFAAYIINGDGLTSVNLQQRATVSAIATLTYKDA